MLLLAKEIFVRGVEIYMYDFDQLKKDVTEVLSCSQELPEKELTAVDKLLRIWRTNKEYFIEKMNGNLIYELPEKISFQIDDETRANRVDEFLNWMNDSFEYYKIKDADLGALAEFIKDNKKDFFSNILSKEYKTEVFLNHNYLSGKKIIIPAGIKIIKAFKYFIEDKNLLSMFQDRASLILQENKLEGRLCFSVHPLDFLSVSVNNMNWRSCHALDGDFRGGNLNYMLDSSTAVVYLKADKPPCSLPGFGNVLWNDKKWRVLFFFSKERMMVFAGRQYPFEATNALYLTKPILQNLFPNTFDYGGCPEWGEWDDTSLDAIVYNENTIHFDPPYIILNEGQGLKKLNDLIKQNYYKLYFNDLLESSVYQKPWFIQKRTVRTNEFKERRTEFYIGTDAPCPVCGSDMVTSSEWMICDGCAKRLKVDNEYEENDELYRYCDWCGQMFPEEDVVFTENGVLCSECFHELYKECTICGNLHCKNELTLLPEGYVCDWCLDDKIREQEEKNGEGSNSQRTSF